MKLTDKIFFNVFTHNKWLSDNLIGGTSISIEELISQAEVKNKKIAIYSDEKMQKFAGYVIFSSSFSPFENAMASNQGKNNLAANLKYNGVIKIFLIDGKSNYKFKILSLLRSFKK